PACERAQGVLPELILALVAAEPDADLVQRIARPDAHVDGGERAAEMRARRETNPACEHVTLRRDERDAANVLVRDSHAGAEGCAGSQVELDAGYLAGLHGQEVAPELRLARPETAKLRL